MNHFTKYGLISDGIYKIPEILTRLFFVFFFFFLGNVESPMGMRRGCQNQIGIKKWRKSRKLLN